MHKQITAKLSGIILLLPLLLAILTSCEYEFIEIDEPDPEVPVSFANDIVPIFTSGNNCTACHRTGSTPPDLTAGNAYNSIVPGLINITDPESSRIYAFPNPSSTTHTFKKYSQAQAALVLAWIKQGAENN